MDDFVLTNLYESRNEWCCRLLNVFTPLVIEGTQSIFQEAWNLCMENHEVNKYLMTFQNLLCRIPKWNSVIIEEERNRIIERSGCNYLEDLITCVHIIQLKVLTSIRVGNKQKKIDITIPKLDAFIHKIYIAVARKVYTNVYLFEKNISPLETQKNNRELEKIVQECILKTIQDSIPTSEIIRAYLDSSVETEEEVIIENIPATSNKNEPVDAATAAATPPPTTEDEQKPIEIPEEKIPEIIPSVKNIDNEPVVTQLTFSDIDSVLERDDKQTSVIAPKTLEELERISTEKYLRRKEEDSDDDDDGRIKIFENDNIMLDNISSLDGEAAANSISLEESPLFDFEELN